MGQVIRTDGTKEEVQPKNREFTNEEMHALIGCKYLGGHTLTGSNDGDLFMFTDDEYLLNKSPYNHEATKLLHKYRPNLAHIKIHGNVLIAGLDETGE